MKIHTLKPGLTGKGRAGELVVVAEPPFEAAVDEQQLPGLRGRGGVAGRVHGGHGMRRQGTMISHVRGVAAPFPPAPMTIALLVALAASLALMAWIVRRLEASS